MSRTPARHQKPSRPSADGYGAPSRHRKQSPLTSALRRKPARIAAVAGTTLIVGVAVVPAVAHWPRPVPHSGRTRPDGATGRAAPRHSAPGSVLGSTLADGSQLNGRYLAEFAGQPRQTGPAPKPRPPAPAARPAAQRHQSRPPAPASAVYRNPLRSVAGLVLERVDMGVDFGGSGPVYALGDAVITSATGDSAGWPGGGWITYQLTDGPAAGLSVYVAEDVQPTAQVGQHVTSATVIASMFNGSDGIETGWAQPGGASAESQLPAAGGIGGDGPFPTEVGLNFDALLRAFGVPAAPNSGQSGYGLLPPDYPADWAAATSPAP